MANKMGVFRGDRLTHIRKRRGLSQEALAELLGTTQQQVSNWERGVDPEPDRLVIISQALDVSIDYLLGVVDDPEAYVVPTIASSALKERLLWALDKGYITEALEAFTLLTKGEDEASVARE